MEAVMNSTATPARQQAGPWVVELKIAGCTIRRRAARRRHLLGLPGIGGPVSLPAVDLARSGLA
jgi:hypothetical protein